jgi:nucleoside-diphosphate-sugar epimerase
MSRYFITGANGFVGSHVVQELLNQGHQVVCLVRDIARGDGLRKLGALLCLGSLDDLPSIEQEVAQADYVLHVAGIIKTFQQSEFYAINAKATMQLAAACAMAAEPPTMVYVSSLAAVGPSPTTQALRENDPVAPVSEYGRSKLAGEDFLKQYAQQIPISIIRPPMVLGPGDRVSLELFKSIARYHVHAMPGWGKSLYSWVDVRDLVSAILLVAHQGERVVPQQLGAGIYHVNNVERVTYAQLGSDAATALGNPWYLPLPLANFALRWAAKMSESNAAKRGNEIPFLNRDKAHEITAQHWICDATKLQQLGFQPAATPSERLKSTVAWYRQQGWL